MSTSTDQVERQDRADRLYEMILDDTQLNDQADKFATSMVIRNGLVTDEEMMCDTDWKDHLDVYWFYLNSYITDVITRILVNQSLPFHKFESDTVGDRSN